MLSRNEILAYAKTKYDIEPDYPWARTPNYAILRHKHNRKWFGAIVDVPEHKLGLAGNKLVDAVNVKCEPLMIGSLRSEPGILPAYHMNKEHWITILLNGAIPKNMIFSLIDLSYELSK